MAHRGGMGNHAKTPWKHLETPYPATFSTQHSVPCAVLMHLFPGVTKENLEAWGKFCQKQYLKVPDTEIKACYGKWEERTKTLVQKQGGGMRW